jgi:glycosyltransferase involved in cell wall biosynthesis
MGQPLVSCLCATYNRAPDYLHLVEEAIESFLRQDYHNKELIILNDTPEQELTCAAEGVLVVNLPRRFRTLGDKQNAAAAIANGDLLAPWDDDDISLSWRLSASVELLGEATYFNPRSYWYLPTSGLEYDHPVGYAHNASIFTRAGFERVGRYRSISVGYDRDIDRAFLESGEQVVDPLFRQSRPLRRDEWFYIYRWGVSPGHVSSIGDSDDGRYSLIGQQPIAVGTFELMPHWRRDYLAETQAVLEQLRDRDGITRVV